MRIPPAAALLAAALAAAPTARAGDEIADAIRRFRDGWTTGLEAMKPEEVDRHRQGLLEPVAASGNAAALEAVLDVARERVSQVARFKERLKKLEEREKEKEKDKPDDGKPGKPQDGAGARARAEEEDRAVTDRREMPDRIAREDRWQPRLAAATGAILDSIPDSEFQKTVAPKLKIALGDRCEGWDAWMAEALGRSVKDRTARLLLDDAEDSLKDYRKALAARAGPAKDLDKVNDEINKIVLPYLEKQQKAGDYSAQIPSNLIPEQLTKERARLEAVVFQLTTPMDAAELVRRTARMALGRMIGGASEDLRGRLFDVVEKEALLQKDFESRIFGLAIVGPCPGDRPMKFLREAAKDPSPEVVVAALDALAGRTEAEVIDLLGAALPDPRWQVRASAAAGLALQGRAAGVPPLIGALSKAEGRTVDDVREALVKLTGKTFPAAAAAWEAWWARDGAGFRGAKDPGGVAGPGGDAAGGDAPAPDSGGNRVSFYGIESRSDKMLFVLDFSGSMNFKGSALDSARKKIDILHEEMKRTITGLADQSKFNIIGFSADVRVWKKGGAVRDSKTCKEAIEWVEKQKVVGSTNIYDALETSFKMMGVGASQDKAYAPAYDTIFFMTDGVPTSGKVTDKAVILSEVKRWNEARRIRIHVVGMGGKDKAQPGGGGPGGRGDDIDKDFLKKLAEENGGQCVFR
jgi:uncharacterized protein YegL